MSHDKLITSTLIGLPHFPGMPTQHILYHTLFWADSLWDLGITGVALVRHVMVVLWI